MRAKAIIKLNDNVSNIADIDIKKPKLIPGHVVIENKAVALNPVDYKIVEWGIIPISYPYVVGLDVAGIVSEVDSHSKFQIGDRVAYHGKVSDGGGLAEYSIIDERVLIRIPNNISYENAAAMMCAGITAYKGLKRKMNLKSGDSILINGGGGGTGSYSILLAKKMGLHVFATASHEKKDYIESLGAIHIDYKKNDVVNSVIDKNNGQRVDAVFELISPENMENNFAVVSLDGVICSIVGFNENMRIPNPSPSLSAFMLGGGAYLYGGDKGLHELSRMGHELFDMIGEDYKKVFINRFGFEETKKAFELLKTSRTTGKIVIKIE